MTSPSNIWTRVRGNATRLLPAHLVERFRNNEAVRRVSLNIAWLGLDKAYSTAVSFVVSIYVARYLGRSGFGLFSYSLAFVTFFQVPATMGLDEILVRELVRHAKEESRILGTALAMRLASSLLMIAVIAIGVRIVRPDDAEAQRLVVITTLLLIPQAFLLLQRLYSARLLAKYNVVSGNIALTLVAVARLAMVRFHASITWFVWTNVALLAFNAIALYAFYVGHKNSRVRWRFSTEWLKRLLRDAWPQIPAGVAGTIQNQIGILLIGSLMGNDQVGIYGVASRFYILLLVVPDIICQSLTPTLTQAKAISDAHFEHRLTQCYRLMFAVFALALAPLLILGFGGIRVLYGAQFAEAGKLMLIFAAPLLLIYLGQLRMWYIIIENQLHYAMFVSVAQAGVSIVCNYFLIRHYGAAGAVAAIGCSAAAVFAFDAVFRPGRRNTRAIISALLPQPRHGRS
jgi:O-antigen/teichoic acid export membrane protein